jgi:hypothetical protein
MGSDSSGHDQRNSGMEELVFESRDDFKTAVEVGGGVGGNSGGDTEEGDASEGEFILRPGAATFT